MEKRRSKWGVPKIRAPKSAIRKQAFTIVLVACTAFVVLGLAIFVLRESTEGVPTPFSGQAKADAPTPSGGLSSARVPAEDPKAGLQAADYFPLSDTFERNYLVEVSYKGAGPRFGLAKLAVEGRETIRGNEYFKLLLRVTGIPEMRDPVLRYCRNAGDAWRELEGDPKRDAADPAAVAAVETVTLPLPPRAAVTWDKDTAAERSNWKIEGTETVVLFGESHPHCLRISYERHLKEEPDYFETGHYFLAPGVGLIKQVSMVIGSRIIYTLDHRSPEEIAFYTAWAGTYAGVRERRTTGGKIQLFADGRYTMIRSTADSAVDSGRYEPNPAREGEMLLLDDHGLTIVVSHQRKVLR